MSDNNNTSGDGVALKEDQSQAVAAAAATAQAGGDHGNKKRTTSEPPTLDNTTATQQQDHAKKQRKEGDEPAAAASGAGGPSSSAPTAAGKDTSEKQTGDNSADDNGDTAAQPPVVWDLESALHQVTNVDNKTAPIEYLDDSKKAWVTFRLGHAGDASTLAALYRTSKAKHTTLAVAAAKAAKAEGNNKKAAVGVAAVESSTATIITADSASSTTADLEATAAAAAAATKNLEAWLADGLGDDNKNPPAVFALMAEMECTPDAEAASAVQPVLKEEDNDDDDDDDDDNDEDKEKASAAAGATTATTPHRRLVAVSILTIAPGTAFHKVTTGKTSCTEQDTKEVQQAAHDAKQTEQTIQRSVVQEGKRHMRVEWLYTVSDGDNIKDLTVEQLELHKQRISMCEKRHLLRLAALAVMTKSQLILVDHNGNATVVGGANRGGK